MVVSFWRMRISLLGFVSMSILGFTALRSKEQINKLLIYIVLMPRNYIL